MLIWNPIHSVISARVSSGDSLTLLIAPFIKVDALTQLLGGDIQLRGLQVIVRWRAEDIAAGVADVQTYEWLKKRGASLYINHNIHLKLYVFESNQALCTSANLTRSGLGYSNANHIEAGSLVYLTDPDWCHLYHLIGASRRVDDEVFHVYQEFLAKLPAARPLPLPPIALPPRKDFTTASLPATDSPDELLRYYMTKGGPTFTPDIARRAAHDLILFDIPPGLDEKESLTFSLPVFARSRLWSLSWHFCVHKAACASERRMIGFTATVRMCPCLIAGN